MNKNRFLITYGLHSFVRHDESGGKSAFTICASESRKMVSHAVSLISSRFGDSVDVRVT